MSEPRTVLVTRPEPAASQTAALLAARGLVPLLAPMLEIVPREGPEPRPADAVLLTSQNGLLGLARMDLPVFAVGAATADAARALGATDVASADGDAADLAALVRARIPPGRTLLLSTGARQGEALAARLRGAGYIVHVHEAYEARPVPSLPADAARALEARRVDFALFYSAETARAFVAALACAHLADAAKFVSACAIGPAVAVALDPLAWRRVRVAARPNQDALLALIE